MRPRLLPLLAAVLLAGCADAGAAPAPRAIAPGVDACDYCHMTVDDPLRAAQWIAADGAVRLFDEPGCLLAWLADHPGASGAAFLADEEGGGWVPAAEAALVIGGVRTGMGFDLVAFRDPEAARARGAASGGRTAGWAELLAGGVDDAHAH